MEESPPFLHGAILELHGPPCLARDLLATEIRHIAGIEPRIFDSSNQSIRVVNPDSGRWAFVGLRASDEAAHALTSGADAVLTLESVPADFRRSLAVLLDDAVPIVVASDIVRWLSARAAAAAPAELISPAAALTRRELEVLDGVIEGLSNGEIAGRLSLSVSTVRTHLSSICSKLGAPTRARLIARGREVRSRA